MCGCQSAAGVVQSQAVVFEVGTDSDYELSSHESTVWMGLIMGASPALERAEISEFKTSQN